MLIKLVEMPLNGSPGIRKRTLDHQSSETMRHENDPSFLAGSFFSQ